MRSLSRVLSGGVGNGARRGYPPRHERLVYVNGNPRAHDRTNPTQRATGKFALCGRPGRPGTSCTRRC